MHLNRASLTDRVHALMRLALHIHLISAAAEQSCDVRSDRLLVRTDFRNFADDRAVDVADLKARRMHSVDGVTKERRRVGAVVPRVLIGKELTDVGKSERTEHGIRHRVQQRIAIGMRNGSARRVDADTAEHKGPARSLRLERIEAVQVVPVPYPHQTVSPWGE